MSFPASIPVFTTLVDDVDFILAADQNDPNDVITAIATMLGAVGAAQSYSTDVLDFLANKQAPIVTKASASTLSVSAGAIVIKNAAQSKRYLKRNTGAVTITAANIDTGAMADDTYYYVYAIGDAAATTFTVVFSTSATNPAVASGVIYELIGWFYNESAGALDVTSGFVGNVKKNGRDVPNTIVKISETQVSTASTSLVDDAQATVFFYSSGRPVRIVYDAATGESSTNGVKIGISVDSSDIASTLRGTGSGLSNTSDVIGVSTEYEVTLAAGTHTIQGRFYTSSANGYINKRTLLIKEA